MDREVIATGITVDEAIEAACEKLGAPRESVDIEVLEMPKKKFFGLKTVPAKVKAVLQSEYANKFIPKPKNPTNEKLVVHHRDGNKYNNHINNLIWLTYSQHSYVHNVEKIVKEYK